MGGPGHSRATAPLVPAPMPHLADEPALFPLPDPLPPWWPFTEAQTRVAQHLAAGKSGMEVARATGLSFYTIRSHLYAMGRILPGAGNTAGRVRAFIVRVQMHLDRHPPERAPGFAPAVRRRRSPPFAA